MIKNINISLFPEVFRIDDIIRLSGRGITRRRLAYAISKLLDEKKLIKVMNGVYSKTGDAFYIAYKLYGGYIGFSSALYVHGIKTEVNPVIYVCTPLKHAKRINILDKIIVPVNMSGQQYGTMQEGINGKEIMVSTYAKTIFDMLSKPRHADYFDMYRAMNIRRLTAEEWKELLYYTRNCSITDIRRIGYATDGISPSWFTKELHETSSKGYRASFFFKHKTENYIRKWDMFDDLGITRWRNAV